VIPETAIVPLTPPPHAEVTLGVVRASGPRELVLAATEVANALAGVIDSKKLYNSISGRRYVRVEGWTTLAAMLGCLPREVSVSRQENGTYEATVELARMADGMVLTRASAECGMDEPTWAKRADYARRSMAVTRATSKACRIAFSWVMVLAGYEVTPAEEIPKEDDEPTTRVELTPVTDADRKLVLEEAAKAGLTKGDFPAFYQEVTGRPWLALYAEDVKALVAECAKRISKRREKVSA
jgi:hypothetical protein